MEASPAQVSNIRRVSERIRASIGADAFDARYPTITAIASSPSDALATFLALRSHLPETTDVIDQFLMLAARLDLQGVDSPQDFTFLDENAEHGSAVRRAIGQAVNLPFGDANSLCHLSNRHKYLYVETPKVACTAIKHSLQRAETEGQLTFRRYGDEHFPVLSPLLAPLDNPPLFLAALASDDWLRFTFVRDPFSRILSCYLDKIVNSKEERQRLLPDLGLDAAAGTPLFGDFLRAVAAQDEADRDAHWASQAWLTQPDTVRYHFIGRLERFEEDFRSLCARLDIIAEIGAVRHSTDAADKLGRFYGADEIALVQSIYAQDFLHFGYDPEQLSPV